MRIFLVHRNKTVPQILFSCLRPDFHLFQFLLRYHTVFIEYTRAFLKVVNRGNLACALAFGCDILQKIFSARQIIKSSIRLMLCNIFFGCVFRQSVRRISNVKNYRLICYKLFLLNVEFFLCGLLSRAGFQPRIRLSRMSVLHQKMQNPYVVAVLR